MGFGILLLLTREGELAGIIVGIYNRYKHMIPDDVLMKVENYSDGYRHYVFSRNILFISCKQGNDYQNLLCSALYSKPAAFN